MANLTQAKLINADLRGAELTEADLTGAIMLQTNLTGIAFNPKVGTLPDIAFIAYAHGLSSLRFTRSPISLIELREAFKKSGLRQQEREITFAIRRTWRASSW